MRWAGRPALRVRRSNHPKNTRAVFESGQLRLDGAEAKMPSNEIEGRQTGKCLHESLMQQSALAIL